MLQKRIVVIEDDHSVRDSLVLVLRSAGFNAIAWRGPIPPDNDLHPDFVIARAELRNGMASSILDLVQAQPSCKLVLLVGPASDGALHEARRRGIHYHALLQPADPRDILRYIRTHP